MVVMGWPLEKTIKNEGAGGKIQKRELKKEKFALKMGEMP